MPPVLPQDFFYAIAGKMLTIMKNYKRMTGNSIGTHLQEMEVVMAKNAKKETYARVKDAMGNEFICPIDALKDIDHATEDELTNCVDDATVGRYAGNIDVAGDEK